MTEMKMQPVHVIGGGLAGSEAAWQIADGIRRAWHSKPLSNREFYSAGTWGPVAADDLLAQAGPCLARAYCFQRESFKLSAERKG